MKKEIIYAVALVLAIPTASFAKGGNHGGDKGPHPSAAAYEHANENARFKRDENGKLDKDEDKLKNKEERAKRKAERKAKKHKHHMHDGDKVKNEDDRDHDHDKDKHDDVPVNAEVK